MRLFLTCWLILTVHWAPFMVREEFPAITLATDGTLNVARFIGWSDDIFVRPDGRAFINNNPGASLLGAIPLIVARPVLDAVERWNDRLPSSVAKTNHSSDFPAKAAVGGRREWWIFSIGFLTVAGLMAPISAGAATYLARELRASGLPERDASCAAALLLFATPIFFRTSYLNHNLLVTHAGLIGALALWNRGRFARSPSRLAFAGAMGGLAVLCDYSGLLVLAFLGLYALVIAGERDWLSFERIRAGAWLTIGALPFLAGLAAYQQWAFGDSILPSQQYMPAIQQTARGYRGMDWPSLRIAAMNFFDPRFGLFVVCPLLALACVAPFVRTTGPRLPRRETGFILAFFAALTLFCAANQYSELQWSTGIRYLVPTVPGLLLLALQTLRTAPATLQQAVAGASVVWAWIPAVTHESPSKLLRDPSEFQLAWARRAAVYGALEHPALATIAALSACAVVVMMLWRTARPSRGGPVQTFVR
jgi:hypothetical protein